MEKKSMSVPEMRAMLGIGKTESYWLVKKHYFRTVMAHGKMRVMLDSFESWYENQVRYKKVNGEPPGANWRHTYSVQDAADILGISDSTVYDLMKKGVFTLYQVGGGSVELIKRALNNGTLHRVITKNAVRRSIKLNESRNNTLKKTASAKTTYTVKEVVEMLGISRQGVYRLIHENCFKAVRTEKKFRIMKASFDAWLDGEKQEDKDGINS